MLRWGLWFLMLFSMSAAVPTLAQEHQKFQLSPQLTLWVLVDSRRDCNLGDVFPGQEEAFKRYVPSGLAPSSILAFLLKSPGSSILIDTGLGGGALEEALAGTGLAPEDISLVLLTHLHGDHIGGLMAGGRPVFPKAKIRLARVEADFWLNEASLAKFPDLRANFESAGRILSAYGKAVEPFEFGAEVAPGLTAVAAQGHTPGHTAYLLAAGPERILFWGDLIHAADLQFPRPDLSPRYDIDPAAAVETRLEFLDRADRD
ncbi:MAG: MBL fold metallo-hydrolase, partial [Candidatus Adiutrix sp.]|nr:MBL fold metallo-hydrolase [Candidatus Adiutrix sp.]